MSYSDPRYAARVSLVAGTDTGTWPATNSSAVGTATDFSFVLPRVAHPIAVVGAKIYRTGTGGTFEGVKAIAYNGTNVLGTSAAFTLNDTTDELDPIYFTNARLYPFYKGTDTAVATLAMKLTGTTTASIAATNEILTVVFDTVEVFDNSIS